MPFIRIEDFEEVRKPVNFGFFAEARKLFQSQRILINIPVKCHRIEAKICLCPLQRCRAERNRFLRAVVSTTPTPQVRRIIGTDRLLDFRTLERITLQQIFQNGDRGQHNIHNILPDDGLHFGQILRPRPEPGLPSPRIMAIAHRADARCHV